MSDVLQNLRALPQVLDTDRNHPTNPSLPPSLTCMHPCTVQNVICAMCCRICAPSLRSSIQIEAREQMHARHWMALLQRTRRGGRKGGRGGREGGV